MYSATRLALALLCALPGLASAADISPADPLLRYVGRFDTTRPEAPRASWSASTVAFTVEGGGSVEVRLDDASGKNHWQVVLDGQPAAILALQAGEHSYTVATDLPARRHTIELVKRTEPSLGGTRFTGLRLADSARLVPTPARPRRIEIIGDSITCGFGNEAPNKEAKFSPETENAWLTYGAIAARALDADYVAIASSGKKLWPDNTLVALYDRVLHESATPKWDFASWTPDVVVINLGTNDFNHANPEEAAWVAAYVKFIGEIRARYPRAPIYCAIGPMISEWPGERKPRSTILGYFEKILAEASAAGGPPVRLVDFGVQAQHHGIGAQWHPSVKTHQLMAEKLVTTLKRDLGW